MKLKDGFVLGNIAGECVVLPSGDELDLNMMMTLNETGKFLWERLEQGTTEEQLVEALLAEYDVSREDATAHVAQYIQKLRELSFIAEE